MATATWYIDSDMRILLSGLADQETGNHVNTAAISAQLQDSEGSDVGDSIDLSYIGGTEGNYSGTLPHTLDLTSGATDTLVVTVTSGSLPKVIKLEGQAAYAAS